MGLEPERHTSSKNFSKLSWSRVSTKESYSLFENFDTRLQYFMTVFMSPFSLFYGKENDQKKHRIEPNEIIERSHATEYDWISVVDYIHPQNLDGNM